MKGDLHHELVQQDGLQALPAPRRGNYSNLTAEQLLWCAVSIAGHVREQTPPPFVDLYAKRKASVLHGPMLVTSGAANGWRILQPCALPSTAHLRPRLRRGDLQRSGARTDRHRRPVATATNSFYKLLFRTRREPHLVPCSSPIPRRPSPRPMQIFIEEAHRLLHRDKLNKVSGETDPSSARKKSASSRSE